MPSVKGYSYYVIFLDDYSKFTWVYPLTLKSEVESTFLHFQSLVERQFNSKIKSIQIDWGGEYKQLNKFFRSIGINYCPTCPHTHE